MRKKVVVEIFVTYGKSDGEELRDRFLIDDTREGRLEALDAIGWYDTIDNKDRFVEGRGRSFFFDLDGGDWDDPTGGYIIVSTKDQLVEEAKIKYNREIESIERLFKEEE